jgi:hypothetical protein
MTLSRNLPFAASNPNESGAVGLMEAKPAFAFLPRELMEGFGASWDAARALYQLAYEQAVAAHWRKRSVLELEPSIN